jgi:uroporphyrinogen-III synthase
MRVIVTRPAREAGHWVRELASLGVQAQALPLISIEPVADTAPLRRAWAQLAQYSAAMFVSGNAVELFLQGKVPPARIQWSSGAIKTRAWAPGPGTRETLVAAGVDVTLIDSPPADAAQFDSEALWRVVAGQVQAGDRVLIVRGGDEDEGGGQGSGREWLAAQLASAGASVETIAAYVRRAPRLDAAQLALARQASGDGSAWLFSSSQAIANLARALPGQDWSAARAIATHPRIAQAARDAGFGVVCESRPAVAAVAAVLGKL